MLEFLIGLLRFFVENPQFLLGLGVVVFFALVFLESDYIKHYGEQTGLKPKLVSRSAEKYGIIQKYGCLRYIPSEVQTPEKEKWELDYIEPIFTSISKPKNLSISSRRGTNIFAKNCNVSNSQGYVCKIGLN